MKKTELIIELNNFKKATQEFHKKRWDYVINIEPDIVNKRIEKNINYKKHNLDENIKLKNAIHHVEYSNVSKERKNEVYNVDKSKLKQTYWKIKKYIQVFWENPWINNFSCYDWYFLNDGYQSEEINFNSIISDIDIMLGKIDIISEKNFKKKYRYILKRIFGKYWILFIGLYYLFLFYGSISGFHEPFFLLLH